MSHQTVCETAVPAEILLILQCFFRQFFHEFQLDVLDLQESQPLVCHEMINFLMETVNFKFRVDRYLVITIGMQAVPNLLPVLAHDNDGGLDCGKDRKDQIQQDERIRVERPGE